MPCRLCRAIASGGITGAGSEASKRRGRTRSCGGEEPGVAIRGTGRGRDLGEIAGGPRQRSTRLVVTAPDEAVQARLISPLLAAVAVRLDGAVGGGGAWVVPAQAAGPTGADPRAVARGGEEPCISCEKVCRLTPSDCTRPLTRAVSETRRHFLSGAVSDTTLREIVAQQPAAPGSAGNEGDSSTGFAVLRQAPGPSGKVHPRCLGR